MGKYYYIGKNIISNDPHGLPTGVEILCLILDALIPTFNELEGPYKSLKELRTKSCIFKELASTNSKRASKILEPKHIDCGGSLLFVEKSDGHSKEFIKLIEHTIRGQIKKRQVYGIHYFDDKKMRIKKVLKSEDKNKVWEAVIEIKDETKSMWIEKKSTFFPKNWTLSRLFNECVYAYKKIKKMDKSQNIYESYTKTGIPVNIIIKDNLLKSIYPIYIE